METPGSRPLVRRLTRPVLAYLLSIILGVWAAFAVEDVKQGGALLRAPVASATAVLESGLLLVVLLAVVLIPAATLALELVHRFAAIPRATRFLLGAASWAGWCLLAAIILSAASGVVLVPEVLAGDLVLCAASGGLFALVAFNGHEARPGKALTALAVAVTAFVVAGSFWMAGRWGGPV